MPCFYFVVAVVGLRLLLRAFEAHGTLYGVTELLPLDGTVVLFIFGSCFLFFPFRLFLVFSGSLLLLVSSGTVVRLCGCGCTGLSWFWSVLELVSCVG